jgi:type IV pilus assembly protein PilN
MIRINLLPHREEAKKARREQFYVLGRTGRDLAALIVFARIHLIGNGDQQSGWFEQFPQA